jgi:AcrR family transcriptional regulator
MEHQMSDPKARSRKNTVDEIQQAIAQVQAGQGKVSISAVAKLAGVTPALIHNTYPDLAEKIRGLVGKATRTQRDAKHDALVREREINRALRQELAACGLGQTCICQPSASERSGLTQRHGYWQSGIDSSTKRRRRLALFKGSGHVRSG